MRRVLAAVAIGLLVSAAAADDWYIRGDFNAWGIGNPMTWDGSRYAATVDISGQTPDNYFECKVATGDWATAYPSSNLKSKYPAQSSLNFYYYPGTFSDGWLPASDRVGFDLAGTAGWELFGGMNGWTAPYATTDMGNGLYQVDVLVATAGHYEFKFRTTGDWNVTVGSDFGSWNTNASFDAWGDNEIHRFELDLPHGCLRSIYLPEPASLLGLALLGILIRRR